MQRSAARRAIRLALSSVLLAGAGCMQLEPAPAPTAEPVFQTAAELTEVSSFGSNPGNLRMLKYVPAGVSNNAPLVVVLHGCTQTGTDYEKSGWSAVADQHKFLIVYAEQNTANNSLRCFNWAGEYGDPTNLKRGEGENLSLKQMVDKMKADYSVDASRVFISGFSGGGAMAALMLAVWPDVFAGGSLFAGIPYNCTTVYNEVSGCLNPGKDKPAATQGQLARDAFPGYTGPYPRVSIWAGSADSVVNPMNQTELLEQFSELHGIDRTPDAQDTAVGHPHREYKDAAGKTLVETYTITGMNHGTPVDPAHGCGAAGSYLLDVKVCGAELSAKFFGLTTVTPTDTVPPTVNLTSPPTGATVTSAVVLSAAAADNVGVTKVEFFANGNSLGTDAAAPYEVTWDTSSVSPGSYALSVKAWDAAGNVALDNDTQVQVQPGPDTTPPVTVAAPGTGGFNPSVTVTLTVNEPGQTFYTLDGSEPTSSSPVYTGPLVFTATTTLKFFSVDAAGNKETTKTATYTLQTSSTAVFTSIAAEDGYAGDLWLRGASAAAVRMGDVGMYNRDSYRGILSFDTSALPEGAQVLSATLKVNGKAVTGTVTAISVDIKLGAFGLTEALAQTDYAAAPSASAVASLPVPAAGAASEVALPTSALAYVNTAGRTQLRLKATTAVDFLVDQVELVGGEDAALAPSLTITYR